MGKFLRISLTIIVGLAILLAIGLGGASWWIMRNLGPDVWVSQLEKKCNCRAQIDDAKLSLFSRPARLSFQGVRIAPRDGEVAKPLSERTRLAESQVPVFIPEIVLEVRLDDLLNKRLFVERLRIISPQVLETQDESGRSSLEALFKKPGSVDEVPRAVAVSSAQDFSGSAQALPNEGLAGTPERILPVPPRPASSDSAAVASADSSPSFAFTVSSASLEDGRLSITNKNTVAQITELDFNLTGIDVDPNDLAQHNRIHASLRSHIQVSGQARIGGVKRPAELADLHLSGEGDIIPINPTTRQWAPTTLLKLTLAEGSVVAGHITMGDAAGKEMKKLQEYGVDLSPVKIGGPLLEPAVVQAVFQNNRFALRSDTRLAFPEYEILIEKNSWFNSAQDLHEMEFRLSCGGALQARLQQGVAKAKLGDSLARGVIKALSDDRGRMTFDIESEGPLSDPSVKPKLDRVLKNLIRGEGLGDLLQGLLKKL